MATARSASGWSNAASRNEPSVVAQADGHRVADHGREHLRCPLTDRARVDRGAAHHLVADRRALRQARRLDADAGAGAVRRSRYPLHRGPLCLEALERGLGDLVTGSDLDGDELAAADPAVGGLIVHAEATRGGLQIHACSAPSSVHRQCTPAAGLAAGSDDVASATTSIGLTILRRRYRAAPPSRNCFVLEERT